MNLPFLIRPNPSQIFRERSERLRQLSQTNSALSGYLGLMADLTRIQHELYEATITKGFPAALNRWPALDIETWRPGAIWRKTFSQIVARMASRSPAADGLAEIGSDEASWDDWADGLLAADLDRLDAALAPFVAAALQLLWTLAAAALDAAHLGAAGASHRCPVCGFLPVASVLQTGGDVQGLRYLVCGLCGSQWNRPRIHCIQCGSSQHVAYFGIEGGGEAVKAEACDACKTYVKSMNREKDIGLDPFADDLASLSLDLLMAEKGYQRLGFSPLLIPG
jgi:FdhE protein